MTVMTDAAARPANGAGLPDDKQRLLQLDDAIARIRTQIATADLKRQAAGQKIDPSWFHRAKTALRHLQKERAEVSATLAAAARKATFKDAIIAVLREQHDGESWARVLNAARLRHSGEAH
jgi:hypothetical protein